MSQGKEQPCISCVVFVLFSGESLAKQNMGLITASVLQMHTMSLNIKLMCHVLQKGKPRHQLEYFALIQNYMEALPSKDHCMYVHIQDLDLLLKRLEL